MTVESEYHIPQQMSGMGQWQVDMAKQIETNQGFPITGIKRELSGDTLFVRVETDLPSQAVENMLSDIADHLPAGAKHLETREV